MTNKTNLTIEEQIEALERTTAATQANIDQQESALADLKAVHRVNLRDLEALRRQQREYNTVENRFKRAVKAIRKNGIHIRTNIVECCRGCVGSEKLGLKDETQPYAWTFGGQGNYLRWDGAGMPYTNERHWGRAPEVESVFYNWGNGAAEAVIDGFKAEGFEVKWDGSEHSCVEVVLA